MAGEFTEMQRRLTALEEIVRALEAPTPPIDQFGVDNQAIGEMHLNVGDGSAGDLLSSDGSGMLQWVAADGSTVEVSGTALQVKDDGIDKTKINADVAGAGLQQAGDGSLETTSAAENYVLVRDVKSANTSGGGFTSGAWRVRVINDETVDTDGLASLPGSNRIRLAAGTWRCHISAPGFQCNRHKIRLWDTTAGAVIAYGSSEHNASTGGYASTRSVLSARFTLSAQSDLRVEHRCQTTKSSDGFGVESNFGVEEVYTIAEFWKVG